MKSKKALVRFAAVVIAVIMCASMFGCISSYKTNPMIAKVGNVKLDLNQYLTLYNNTDSSTNMYYAYLQYGIINREQYANYILDDLVNYGVQLDQVEVQGITLDETEEADVVAKAEEQIKSYCDTTYKSKIDSAITDAEEQYKAELELLKEDLKAAGNTFEAYRSNIEDGLRKSALVQKLHDVNVADVTVNNDDVKAYFADNAKTDVTAASFNQSFTNFVTRTAEGAPLFMPHPERAVEDDPDTADTDESKEANPYGEIFSVQHVLIKFTNEAGDADKDLAAYAAEDKEFTVKMNAFESEISGLDTQGFLDKCHDKEVCEDPGMLRPAYQYFGYIMQESLLSSYFDGFGYAAMKLKFGEAWEPAAETEENASETADDTSKTDTEQPAYIIKFFDLTDGAKVVKVFTKSGAHYIIVNPNDCFGMYDEDGYLMLPLYEEDQLLTDAEGIVTANGHMTQEQLDKVNEILAFVSAETGEPTEEATKDDADAEAADDENSEDAEEPADAEDDEEPAEPVTAKTLYDFFRAAKLTAMQSEVFTEKFNTWKENTKIVTKKNLLTAFSVNG